MLRINRSNRLLNPLVKRNQPRSFPIGRFVERVVPGNPSVVFVMLQQRVSVVADQCEERKTYFGEPFPEEDGAVLEILVFPEQSLMHAYSLRQPMYLSETRREDVPRSLCQSTF